MINFSTTKKPKKNPTDSFHRLCSFCTQLSMQSRENDYLSVDKLKIFFSHWIERNVILSLNHNHQCSAIFYFLFVCCVYGAFNLSFWYERHVVDYRQIIVLHHVLFRVTFDGKFSVLAKQLIMCSLFVIFFSLKKEKKKKKRYNLMWHCYLDQIIHATICINSALCGAQCTWMHLTSSAIFIIWM